MLASISPIAAPENLPVHANFNAIISSIPCNAAIVPAPDHPWMTSKSLAMSLCNAAVECISVTALSRTGEPWSWVLDLSTFGCNIKVYQHNTNISVSTDNTNWFILKWHSNSKLCDYHICLLMRGTEIQAINLQVMTSCDIMSKLSTHSFYSMIPCERAIKICHVIPERFSRYPKWFNFSWKETAWKHSGITLHILIDLLLGIML